MKGMKIRQRVKLLGSMGFGLFLLALIITLSIAGTILPQGMEKQFYINKYSDYIAELIDMLGLDHVFTSVGFAVLFGALAVNLLLCSTTRLGKVVQRVKNRFDPQGLKQLTTYKLQNEEIDKDLPYIFRTYGAQGLLPYKQKGQTYYCSKNMLGYFGSWFLHLGIMLVILFYIYGQATFYSEDIYGVPGDTMHIKGTDYHADIVDFDIKYHPQGSVEQYTTLLSLKKGETVLKQGKLNVNNPFRYMGYSFYQTSTGWAASCSAFKNGAPLKSQLLYEKSACVVPEENIAIALTKFYPDFYAKEQGFGTLSDKPNNPVLLYAIYYRNELVSMDIAKPGENIRWNEFSFHIDNFKRYTYLKVNKMKGQTGAAIGGLLIVLGLGLTFFFKPCVLIVKQQGNVLHIYGNERKLQQETNPEDMKLDKLIQKKGEGLHAR